MAVCMCTCIRVCVCHRAVHNGSRAAARACGMVSESYDVTCGVCQGCIRYQHFLICISTLSSLCHWTVTECRTNVLKLPIFTNLSRGTNGLTQTLWPVSLPPLRLVECTQLKEGRKVCMCVRACVRVCRTSQFCILCKSSSSLAL